MGLRASPAFYTGEAPCSNSTDHLVPFCRNEGLPFLPRHGSRQRWTGHGNEKHGVLGSMSVIHVLTLQAIPY